MLLISLALMLLKRKLSWCKVLWFCQKLQSWLNCLCERTWHVLIASSRVAVLLSRVRYCRGLLYKLQIWTVIDSCLWIVRGNLCAWALRRWSALAGTASLNKVLLQLFLSMISRYKVRLSSLRCGLARVLAVASWSPQNWAARVVTWLSTDGLLRGHILIQSRLDLACALGVALLVICVWYVAVRRYWAPQRRWFYLRQWKVAFVLVLLHAKRGSSVFI